MGFDFFSFRECTNNRESMLMKPLFKKMVSGKSRSPPSRVTMTDKDAVWAQPGHKFLENFVAFCI